MMYVDVLHCDIPSHTISKQSIHTYVCTYIALAANSLNQLVISSNVLKHT